MSKIIETVHIKRSRSDVYRRLVDDVMAQNRGGPLFSGVLGHLVFELSPRGAMQVGSILRESVRTTAGYEVVLNLAVVELEDGAKFHAKLLSGRRLRRLDHTFLFEAAPGGTKLTMILDYGVVGFFGKSLEKLIGDRIVHQVWRTALDRLKRELEEGVGSGISAAEATEQAEPH